MPTEISEYSSSQASTRREIATMQAENTGMQNIRSLDGVKENALRSQGTNQQFGMLKYEAIPGGSQVMGTSLPSEKGLSFTIGIKENIFCKNQLPR